MIMFERFAARSLILVLSLYLAVPLRSAETAAPPTNAEDYVPASSLLATNEFQPVAPGPIDGQVAYVTARMLELHQYLKEPFDASVSSRFLDRYLETLDPARIYFTQGDLADFERYRTNLDHLTLDGKRHGVADTTPACVIFNRFMQRVEQRVAYVDDLLQHDKFTFDTDDRIQVNRKDMPYPADLKEAEKLWRERLRYEYLQELLGKIGARKKSLAEATKHKPLGAATNSPAAPVPPAMTESRRPSGLPSPKDAERASTAPAAEANAQAPGKLEASRTTPEPAKGEAAGAPPKKSDHDEIVETLRHRYQRNLRFFTDWNDDDVLQTYLTALAHVYDPHSDYLGHAQLEQFSIAMNLSLFGIGAELVQEDGYCKIRRLLPGGPAIKSKLIKENDRIVAVSQSNGPPVDVVEMSLNKAVQLIRGPKGTEVRLTLIPAGADASTRKVVSIIRDEIPLEESAAKAKLIEVPNSHGETVRLGVIDLPSFYATFDTSNSKERPEPKSTTADVAQLLAKLKQENVAGVILDLRRNGGGSLEEAIRLTGLFVRTNPVVQVRDENDQVQQADDPDPRVAYDGPLLVLTSRFSASASEIVAGALQDYGRALIVGDSSTHGKGTVQSVNQLRPYIHLAGPWATNDPGALKVTIKKFYRPSGASTQKKGVVPDIVLPSVANESKDIGEVALENPLPWDTIPSAKYETFNLVEPYLPELRKRSAERVATDPEFAFVREDIALFKKQQADKTISLNEQKRLQEQDEAEARQKARDQERAARIEPPEKVYELTLKLAAQPGLPPPVGHTNAPLAKLGAKPGTGLSGASTNVASASVPTAVGEDNSEEADATKPPAPDAPLDEAEHILLDYLSLLPKGDLVTVGH